MRKAVIPAAGLGTRFLPASKAMPKEMMPVLDKPSIQYVVEEAVRCGIDDILIITRRGKTTIEDHFDRSVELEEALERAGRADELAELRAVSGMAAFHYMRQAEARGLGHAVSLARAHVGDEPFVVILGDDIMHERSPVLSEMLAVHERFGTSVLALKEVTPREVPLYGCVSPEAAGEALVRVLDIVEKPPVDEAPSNLAVMGRYVLTPAIFEVLESLPPGRGGEIQLTDAIGVLLGREDVYGHVFRDGRFDVGNKADYLRATVEFALERPDLGPDFGRFLAEIVKRESLG
ncbi:MAG TPA: UTP--glucose-1-phosphate uridylyltransferase GalU [Acidimicrobiales bacterium]|nr:UTP--glucose-1-phosphate uridylyltransferase GalU [Acidimicrobiales bacterium]